MTNIRDTYDYVNPEKKEAIEVIDSLINDVAPLLTIDRWEQILCALSIALPESSLVFDESKSDEGIDEGGWLADNEDFED
jgi:hypothetical protein